MTTNGRDDGTCLLASASPRRSELLNVLGWRHQIVPADIDESAQPNEAPLCMVERLARAKARKGAERSGGSELPVLGADTIVVIGPRVLGKPRDKMHAFEMLSLLSGRIHQVMTAVSVFHDSRDRSLIQVSSVTFGNLTARGIEEYLATEEPWDKAGGYAIQGRAAAFVQRIEGSYSGVMGLPLFETGLLLRSTGYRVFNRQLSGYSRAQ